MNRTKMLVFLIVVAAFAMPAVAVEEAATPKQPALPPEQKVLDRHVGNWQGITIARKAKWHPNETRVSDTSSCVRVLGGRFTLNQSKGSDGSSSLSLATYDVQRKCYRLWWFGSQGTVAELQGQWDAKTNTMTWRSDQGNGVTSVGKSQYLDDNTVKWSSVTKDADGEIGFHIEGKATRVKHLGHEKIRVHVPVEPDFGGAVVSEVQVTPWFVEIRVSGRDWQQILKGPARPVLRTVRIDPKLFKAGKPVDLIPSIGGVRVEPGQTTVKVRAKFPRTEARELTVPVQVVVPPKWLEDGTWKQFALMRRNPSQWRAKIQVGGERRQLDHVRAKDVLAFVRLTEDDKKPIASWLRRAVRIRLPRHLNLKLLGAPPEVELKLVRRAARPPVGRD